MVPVNSTFFIYLFFQLILEINKITYIWQINEAFVFIHIKKSVDFLLIIWGLLFFKYEKILGLIWIIL